MESQLNDWKRNVLNADGAVYRHPGGVVIQRRVLSPARAYVGS